MDGQELTPLLGYGLLYPLSSWASLQYQLKECGSKRFWTYRKVMRQHLTLLSRHWIQGGYHHMISLSHQIANVSVWPVCIQNSFLVNQLVDSLSVTQNYHILRSELQGVDSAIFIRPCSKPELMINTCTKSSYSNLHLLFMDTCERKLK
jgi:hypothetical protein